MELIKKIAGQRSEDVSHADLVDALLELGADVEQMKADIASGRAGAKVTDIDPERIAKTTGQT